MRWPVPFGRRGRNTRDERCERRVRALGLPVDATLTIEELCRHVGRLRGRPVQLLSLTLPLGSPHGLWVSTESREYVVFEKRLAPVHQRQVILHEIGHIVCDHAASPSLTAQDAGMLLPSLSPDLVRRVLGREHGQSEVEIEAELVGSLIGGRIGAWTADPEWPVAPEARRLAARLAELEPPAVPGRG
ncbi:ImmA/IrrE family metallo-endopeptidase [Streptomyces finlayi]|uniref:ImmA/IrrE family metallo-endopeptidase n=1 Tax=Streptomyces finlayi TaxID=67296 RepID=UPI00162639E4|nr:ImmA/IrrE family metallo-endopeptidase [Streptomyces finlayi]